MWKNLRLLHKEKLDKISPTLCLAKYTQSNIYLGSGTTHSCYHCPAHSISLDDFRKNLSSFHNTKEKIEQRTMMLDGKRPDECSYCWKVEDRGNYLSDRITKSFNDWSRNSFDKILQAGPEGINPTYLELSFDNRCNLKCSYCGPHSSNSWSKELEKFGPWPDEINSYNQTKMYEYNEYNPYIEAFWEWFPSVYKDLHTFRLTGGEPLLSKNTYKMLDYFIEHPNTNIELGVNTNLSVPSKLISIFIEKIKQIKVRKLTIHVSCDSHGSAAEYARNGLVYSNWLKNCKRLVSEIPHANIDVMVAYNVFSVTRFKLLMQDIESLNRRTFFNSKIKFSIGYITYPEHLAIWMLPLEFKDYIIDQIDYMKKNKFTPTEINQLERLLDLFLSYSLDKEILRKRFKMFVSEHDKRRKTNFLTSMPEMENFYKLC